MCVLNLSPGIYQGFSRRLGLIVVLGREARAARGALAGALAERGDGHLWCAVPDAANQLLAVRLEHVRANTFGQLFAVRVLFTLRIGR